MHETFVDTTVSVLAKCSVDHYRRPLIAEQFYWIQAIIIKNTLLIRLTLREKKREVQWYSRRVFCLQD